MNAAVKTWAIDTASRTVKTFAQAEVGAITAHTAKILPGDLVAFTAAAGIAALVCVFTNIQSFPTGAIDGTGSTVTGSDPVGSDLESGWIGPSTSPDDGPVEAPAEPTPAADPEAPVIPL